MAGHFVLRSISQSDLVMAQQMGCGWSALMHDPVGWTPASRAELSLAFGAGLPGNRDGLPPHRYLQFGPFGVNVSDLRSYIAVAGWADTVIRPNMGLTGLNPAAQQRWNGRDPGGAVLEQAIAGATSVEIYYLSGYEMS
jgi:hypothetical protein